MDRIGASFVASGMKAHEYLRSHPKVAELFGTLPDEILLIFLSFTTDSCRLAMSLTERRFRRVTQDTRVLGSIDNRAAGAALKSLGIHPENKQYWDSLKPTKISVEDATVTDEMIEELCTKKDLEEIVLKKVTGLTPEHLEKLSQLEHVHTLEIADTHLRIPHLKKLQLFTKLHTLKIPRVRVRKGQLGFRKKTASHLAQLKNLRILDLTGNVPITDDVFEELATLPNLRVLNVSGCCLGTPSTAALAKLTNLETLFIASNYITSEGAQHISTLPNLHTLDISYTQIGRIGAQHLVELPNLTSLTCYSSEIPDEVVKTLERPGLSIAHECDDDDDTAGQLWG